MAQGRVDDAARAVDVPDSTARGDAGGNYDAGGNSDDHRRPRISSLKKGDPDAWRWFVDEFGQALVNYAARMGHPDPDEVMGATMEAVARGIATFEGSRGQFRSYVFSVAHGRIVDELRRSSRRTNLGQGYLDTMSTIDDPPVLGSGFDDESVTAALACLSDDQRTMIYLRYVEGLSTKETATAVGKSEVATRVALSRGLSQLRDILSAGRGG